MVSVLAALRRVIPSVWGRHGSGSERGNGQKEEGNKGGIDDGWLVLWRARGREIEHPGISAGSNCRLKMTPTMRAHLSGGKERGRGNGSETTGWAVGLKLNWAAQSSFYFLFYFLLSSSSFLIS
jgi:hypothetical protein